MSKYYSLLIGAVTGLTLINGQALSEPIDKEIVCKLPEYTQYPLKLHSCATLQYPLAPLQEPALAPPEPIPPYTS